MITLYGIKNCDTVKKARNWLDKHHCQFQFHDVRADGLERQQVEYWAELLGWQTLLNKRSTTWKQLSTNIRENIEQDSAIDAMVQYPTLIKRPVLDNNGQLHVGFNTEQYQSIFQTTEA